jgi:hypothetical protein
MRLLCPHQRVRVNCVRWCPGQHTHKETQGQAMDCKHKTWLTLQRIQSAGSEAADRTSCSRASRHMLRHAESGRRPLQFSPSHTCSATSGMPRCSAACMSAAYVATVGTTFAQRCMATNRLVASSTRPAQARPSSSVLKATMSGVSQPPPLYCRHCPQCTVCIISARGRDKAQAGSDMCSRLLCSSAPSSTGRISRQRLRQSFAWHLC